MRVVMFYHSLISDWNHGNAHFLRGIVSELSARGHDVRVYEPRGSWSLSNLLAEHGDAPIAAFRANYPGLRSTLYDPAVLDLEAWLDGADLVIVHEWNTPELVRIIGEQRASSRHFKLLFHDTHHRAVSARDQLARYDLRNYDGVLAFGDVLRDLYVTQSWIQRAWTWHEAADTRRFQPLAGAVHADDLVWIGNWGDGERSQELHEFLLGPVAELRLSASVFGVRYPDNARSAIEQSGARYRGWLPNFAAPAVFATHRVTVHIPRRYYARALPGIPTIRVFEALACGIPLICAPWDDSERLFVSGSDYLVARNGAEMKQRLRDVLADRELARQLAEHGRRTIERRHTCAHRVDELLDVVRQLRGAAA